MLDGTLSGFAVSSENSSSTPSKYLVDKNSSVIGPRYPETTYLPLDAQKRLDHAQRFASHIKTPIETMLTVNAAHLQRMGASPLFACGHLWDIFQNFHELLRKWVKNRGVDWSAIWVREYTGGKNEHYGEHWHIALHLPHQLESDLAAQVALWTEERLGEPSGKKTCIACSVDRAWYISRCNKYAGQYLGKATPKTRYRHGKKVPNELRLNERSSGEGPIQGKRYGISKHIGATARAKISYA